MSDSPFTPSYLDALFAFEALSRGTVCTMVAERLNAVTEEVLWSETAPAVRAWIPSPRLEARLLAGLGIAASLALIEVQMSPAQGREGTYLLRWQRRVVASASSAASRASDPDPGSVATGRAVIDLDRYMLERRDRPASCLTDGGIGWPIGDDAQGRTPGLAARTPDRPVERMHVAV